MHHAIFFSKTYWGREIYNNESVFFFSTFTVSNAKAKPFYTRLLGFLTFEIAVMVVSTGGPSQIGGRAQTSQP